MKRWYFILASIILFNPLVSIFDIFPDFIAYLLLLKAFSKMSYIDAKAEDTCRYLRILTFVTIAKSVAFFMIPALDTAMYLVYSFVFAVLEILFGYFLFTKMFEALSAYSLQVENIACSNNDRIRNFTLIAHVARLLLGMLPDLTELSINNGADTQTHLPLTYFKPALFFVSVVISFIVQAVWLVLIIIYYKRLLTKRLEKTLKSEYISCIEKRPSLVMSKDLMMFSVVACISSVFVLDFNLDLVNVLFDSFFSVIMLILFTYILIKKHFQDVFENFFENLHLFFNIFFAKNISNIYK